MFEAEAQAKALRPRPKFWPRGLNISNIYMYNNYYKLFIRTYSDKQITLNNASDYRTNIESLFIYR